MPVISRKPICALPLFATLLLLPMASSAKPEFARWAGHYVDDRFSQTIDIDAQGHVHSTGMMFFGGDAGMGFRAEGTLNADGAWLTLVLQPKQSLDFPAELLKPQRWLPLVSEGRRFLLDERGLDGIANDANLSGNRRASANFGVHELFPGEEHNRPSVQVDADAVLPPAWRARLLAKPLSGHVTHVVASVRQPPSGGPSSFAVGPPPRPGEGPPQPPLDWRRTTLAIDLGSADGVFVGMILCVSQKFDEYFWVDSVEPHRSTATTTTTAKFAAGDAVGSQSLRSAR